MRVKRTNIQEFEKLLAEDKDRPRITVINEVDNEVPPHFTYINDYVYGKDVPEPNLEFLSGCDCDDQECLYSRCPTKKNKRHRCSCLDNNEGKQYYDTKGRVKIDLGHIIYECNVKCHCDDMCPNRVVQQGRKVALQVFKTIDKGWGVRAVQSIPKSTFVCLYLGEMITESEAAKRGRKYDRIGRTYLFDLDIAEGLDNHQTQYTIDGFEYGNVAHFFNHSCEPNMVVYPIVTNNVNFLQHHVAFFTKEAVKVGEELTFDYLANNNNEESLDTVNEGSKNYKWCKCGSSKCRRKVKI